MGVVSSCEICHATATFSYRFYVPICIHHELPEAFLPWAGERSMHEDGKRSESVRCRCHNHPLNVDNLPEGISFIGCIYKPEGFWHCDL